MDKGNQRFYLFLNLLSSFLIVSGATSGIKSIGLVLMSILMLPCPIAILPMIFVSSWSISFVAIPGVAAFFYYLVLFALSIILNINNSVYIVKSSRYILFALLFALWIFFRGFQSVSGDWYLPMKIALYILPVIIFMKYRFRDIAFFRTSLVVIALFFTLYFLYIALFNQVDYLYVIEENGEPLNTLQSLSFRSDMNPNTASQIVLPLFFILFCEVFRSKKYWFLYFCFALLDIVLLMYLGSRTAFFTVIITVFLYLMFILKTSFVKKIFLVLVIGALAFGVNSQKYRFEQAERLNVSSLQEDEGNGRFITWKYLSKEVIPNNWLKGIGVGRNNYNRYGFDYDADNMYIDLLCQTGVIGLTLFLLYYFRNLYYLFRLRGNKQDWNFLIAIFLAYLVEGWGESVFDTPLFWFCALMAILAVNDMRIGRKRWD